MSKATENSYSTAKKLYTGTVISAIAATASLVGTIGTAHADTVEVPLPTTAQTEPALVEKEAPKKTEVEVPTKEVTKGQVDVAKDKLDKSTQAVEDAQAKKSQAQTAKDQAQTEVDNAQSEVGNAQQAKDKATPENIEKQKQSVASAEKGKNDAEKQKNNAENDLTKAKEVVADQEIVVHKSEKKVADALNEVKDARNDVDNAQAILDGTGQAKVVEEKENAETAQKQAQKQVTNAEEVLEQAKSDDKNLEDAISSVQNELTEASKVVESTESTLTDATKKADQTQTALEKAQDTFTVAEASYKSINTFQVTDEYVNALKSYVNNPYDILDERDKWKEHREKVESILKSVNQENLNLNKFKGNVNDKAISVDANNLTTEQMTELSLFASDLLNQIRERFGTPRTVVTKGMLQVADEVTDGYVADNWGFGKGHDSKAVNNVARKYGLPTYEDDTQQYLENLNSVNSGDEIHTMYDAKKWVYESISDLLFNGWEWMHAQNLTGVSSVRGSTKEYFALDISKSLGRTSAHFISVFDNQVTGNKLDKTEVPNNNTAESIVKAYNNANSALLNAQTVNSQAQREKTSASLANIKAKGEQETIQKRLDALKATPLKTPTAQSKLEQAQDILANANTRLKNANKALDALTADVKLKQENLDKAKEVLAQKERNLTNAKNNLATEQDKLVELKALVQIAENNLELAKEKVAQANKTLEQAKADLENLLNAEPNLAKAKEVLAQKETTLKEKVTALKEAQANLDKLLKEQKIDQEAYDKFFALYSEQVEAERLADLEAQKKAILEAGNTPIEVYDETGKLVSYQVKPKTVSQSPASYNGALNKKQEKSLPNTGENSSVLGLIGVSIISALGLSVNKRKNK
ncbi:SEC10/PgrA surface exclusion domain-containing protein [Streptococcus sp. SO4]|uniref:SEC10/PgrA surface exclusion domain-containing protein n=1 Tax=Streptococcus sp. SO4 TaxID=3018249 RepID=UPI00263EF1D5|nr:SEC10/PgrA surface exclusion domain-containing protein [Streptococcus sp. SO4]MDN5025140.1 SEC10/PgrA surface exclusion domain-containing protein [Streptococcus sp. SO4]